MTDQVTIVHKRIVYDEVCIPFSKFNEMSKQIADNPYETSWNDLNFELDTCQDLCDSTERFAAFEGDIYSMADDVIAHGDFYWTDRIDELEIEEPRFCGDRTV